MHSDINVGEIRVIRTMFGSNLFVGRIVETHHSYCRVKGLTNIRNDAYQFTNRLINNGELLNIPLEYIGRIVSEEEAMAIAL